MKNCHDEYYFLVPIVLVANKTDLLIDTEAIHHLADEMAEKIGAYAYLKCSAKADKGVWEVFETAVKAIFQT